MNKFTCAICGTTYHSNTSDEEMQKEMGELFGPELATMDESAPVCDDCFNKIHPRLHPEVLERAKQSIINQRPNQ